MVTTRMKVFWAVLAAMALFGSLSLNAVFAQESQEETEQRLIQIAAESDTFVDWLAQHEGWVGHSYPPDEGVVWYTEFFTNENNDEWLGYANVNAETGEIQDAFAPIPLPTDQFQEIQPRIQQLVLDDPEVQARVGDLATWDVYTDYNRYDADWEIAFYRGVEAVLVKATLEEGDDFSIHEIVNPHELTDEQNEQIARDTAIGLAYGAPDIDKALDGHDNWKTYVENQGGTRWSVSFNADDRELFYALVDVSSNKVLESSVGGG